MNNMSYRRDRRGQTCVVCKKNPGSIFFSSYFGIWRTVSYCSFRCRLIANRLFVYAGGIIALIIGIFTIWGIIIGAALIILALIGTSENRKYKFPLISWEALLD